MDNPLRSEILTKVKTKVSTKTMIIAGLIAASALAFGGLLLNNSTTPGQYGYGYSFAITNFSADKTLVGTNLHSRGFSDQRFLDQPVTLTWNSTGASSCIASNGPRSGWTDNVNKSVFGSQVVYPETADYGGANETQTYTLTCYNQDKSQSATRNVSIGVRTWKGTTQDGNYNESCNAWLSRIGQKGINNSVPWANFASNDSGMGQCLYGTQDTNVINSRSTWLGRYLSSNGWVTVEFGNPDVASPKLFPVAEHFANTGSISQYLGTKTRWGALLSGFTVAKNTTVANMSVVAGQTGATIGSWLFTAGAAEAVNINTIVLKDGVTGPQTWGDAFSNLKLYSGSTQLGSTIASPTATGDAVTQTFNLSTPLRISAGQSVRVDLVADVITGASWKTDGMVVDSASGIGVSTSAAVSYAGDSAGQDIAVATATAGTLTVAVAAAPTNPSTSYMVAGDTNQTVATWKFTADNIEDLKVTRIKLKQAQTDVSAPNNVKNLKLFVGSSQVGSTVPVLTNPGIEVPADEYAVFENANGLFTVPKNSTVTLVLKTDITPATNAVFSVNGTQFKFRVANITTHTASTDISAIGLSSGAFALGSASANYDGNSQIVVKTKPMFSIAPSSSGVVLVPGMVEVLRFNITAHSAGDVIFDGRNHNIRFTISQKGGTATAKKADLYDASTNTTITGGNALNYDLTTTNGALNFSIVKTTIPAGQTKTYYVKVDLADYATTGESFQLTINNAATDVSWSDGTTLADINNANVSNVGLPLVGTMFIKP